MGRRSSRTVNAAGLLVAALFATPAAATQPSAAEEGFPTRFEDPVGDTAGGLGPDITAITARHAGGPLVSFAVEFAAEPPLGYDLATQSTDMLMISLATQPEAVYPEGMEYVIGTHGASLSEEAERGAHLYTVTSGQLLWGVVDVAVDGRRVTLTLDRQLLGEPDHLYLTAGVVVEGEAETSGGDTCPDEGLATYTLLPWR